MRWLSLVGFARREDDPRQSSWHPSPRSVDKVGGHTARFRNEEREAARYCPPSFARNAYRQKIEAMKHGSAPQESKMCHVDKMAWKVWSSFHDDAKSSPQPAREPHGETNSLKNAYKANRHPVPPREPTTRSWCLWLTSHAV